MFRVWGSRALVRDTSADKLSARAIPCVFLGFPLDAPGWQFHHPTSRRVLLSQDVTFDESVPFYHLFPYRFTPLSPPPLFVAPGPPLVDPLPGTVHVEVTVASGAARGAASGGAASGGVEPARAEPGGAEPAGAEPGGAESEGAGSRGTEPASVESGVADPEGAERGGVESEGAKSRGAEPRGTASSRGPAGASPRLSPRPEPLSPQQLREWFAQHTRLRSGAAGAGDFAAGGIAAGGPGGAGAAGPGGAHSRGTGAARSGGAGGARAGDPGVGGAGAGGTGAVDPGARDTIAAGASGVGGVGAGGAGAGGAGTGDPGAGGAGARGAGAGDPRAGGAGAVEPGARGAGARGAASGGTGAGGTVQRCPFFVPSPPSSLPPPDSVLRQVLSLPSSTGLPPNLLSPPPRQSQSQLQPNSPLPAPSPYAEQIDSFTERPEPASRPALPVRAVRTGRRVPCPRSPRVPGTHVMALRPSSVPLRVPLPPPLESSLPAIPSPESDLARTASPTVTRLLVTIFTDPSFESNAVSALIAELVDFAATCSLDYATSLVVESESECPPSVGGECALGTDVLEDRQEEFKCLEAAIPHLVAMLLAPERDPDAQDILIPRSYAKAITGPYSSQWQTAMDAEMASWSPQAPTSTQFPLLGRTYLHEEIWLRRPPGFTGSFPAGTQWSLRRPVYRLSQGPREWHDTLRTTLAALGFAPSTADPSLFLRTDTSLPPFYVLMYVDDLVFATANTEALALVKSELQKRHTCTDLGELRSYLGLQITQDRARRTITLTQSHMVHQVLQRFVFRYSSPQSTPLPTDHSLSAPPSDESVEPSGSYTELVGCLMYLKTCTRPDLAYPLSILARYVAPERHRSEHWEAAKRVLRYLCSTSGMGLVLGGRDPVVLTGHADASWVDDLATQRSSHGYTFSLGSGSISWRSTRSSSVLGSSCEAEIYAEAMAAQELHWLTYLLTDLGERPRSSPVLYVDNKAMIALC
ncbi:unnamed protein product [Closterium sp. NIES-54]